MTLPGVSAGAASQRATSLQAVGPTCTSYACQAADNSCTAGTLSNRTIDSEPLYYGLQVRQLTYADMCIHRHTCDVTTMDNPHELDQFCRPEADQAPSNATMT